MAGYSCVPSREVSDGELKAARLRVRPRKCSPSDLRRILGRTDRPLGTDNCVMSLNRRAANSLLRSRKGKDHTHIRFGPSGQKTYFHRVMYELFIDDIPTGGMVLHRCPVDSNGRCVNPFHLYIGNQADNSLDGRLNGSFAKKLTEDQVREMRALKASGLTQQQVANRYNVSRSTVRAVTSTAAKRQDWKHVQ